MLQSGTKKNEISVALLIVNHNGLEYLRACLPTVAAAALDGIACTVYIVDCASTDDSVAYIERNWPAVRLVKLHENRGFAGGNNTGWQVIQREVQNVQYLYLLNQDTEVDQYFLTRCVDFMERNPQCGSVQSRMMLDPDREKINSLGNVIHFLGFGYASYCDVLAATTEISDRKINYASGAACMIRASALRQLGLYEDFMFMYLEDLDLGWRLTLAGWENWLVADSVVYHKYEFHRSMRQYYYFERNRLYVLLKNYTIPTMLVIAPAFIVMEFGQLWYAMAHGVLNDKLRSYAFFFSRATWRRLSVQRTAIRRARAVRDRTVLGSFSGVIDFQPVMSPLLTKFANPLLQWYLRVAVAIVRW